MVLVCYLDDSGTHRESSVVTVAGFTATSKDWARFEGAAEHVYAEYGISGPVHAHAMNSTDGDFKGWSMRKKQDFCSTLFSHLVPSLSFGISVSAHKEMYATRKKEYDVWHNHSAFGNAFMNALLHTYQETLVNHPVAMSCPEIDLSIIMEDGNRNNGDALNVFNHLKHERGLPKLASMSFAGKRDCKAIHLADLLAYYTRRWMDSCVKADRKVAKPAMLAAISEGIQVHTMALTDFADLSQLGGAPPDDQEWWRVRLPPPRKS